MSTMYTSQTATDAKLIEEALDFAKVNGCVRVLEVGVFGGDTSRGIKAWCDNHQVKLDFWGIDDGSHPCFKTTMAVRSPFDGCTMVFGDSAEVFHKVPFGLDVALIDGCHCVNHAILDTVHYGRRIRPGGLILFHDTAPGIQQTMKDPHGPDIPEFHNSVLLAHSLIGFPFAGWVEWKRSQEAGAKFGGITAYLKK